MKQNHRRNQLLKLHVEGERVIDAGKIKEKVKTFFVNAFRESHVCRPQLSLIEFIKEFHANVELLKVMTAPFLALIPNQNNPKGMQEYKPISLISNMYKILSKLLA